MAKKRFPKVVSPVAVAAYAWTDRPDEGDEYSDGKYKVTLVLDNDDPKVSEFIDQLTRMSEEVGAEEFGKLPRKFNLPFRDGGEKKDEWEGKTIITAKTKFRPAQYDQNKESLGEGQGIRSGDLARASLVLMPYKAGGNTGVTCQLRAIQLIERRTQTDAADDFDDEFAEEEAGNTGGEGGDDDYNF